MNKDDIRLKNPCMNCSQKYYCDKDCWEREAYIEKVLTNQLK